MKTAAILVARLIFAFVFGMAAAFKFALMGIDATAAEIAGAGFPIPHLLAWAAAFFEVGLGLAFLPIVAWFGIRFRKIAYVLFLAFSFHGPDRWGGNPMEFGFFIDHFTFVAGLLFAAVHGPGRALVLKRSSNRVFTGE